MSGRADRLGTGDRLESEASPTTRLGLAVHSALHGSRKSLAG